MKNKRQDTLLELIKDNVISTQEDLLNSLESCGFSVTQSTISRDIKELRIVKALDSNGQYRYISAFNKTDSDKPDKYVEIFSNSVISIRYAMNDVVIKCYPGMASGACVAVDHLYNDLIFGSLAGDDTIFIITESESVAKELTDKLNKLI